MESLFLPVFRQNQAFFSLEFGRFWEFAGNAAKAAENWKNPLKMLQNAQMSQKDEVAKSIRVPGDVFWALKGRAAEERLTVPELLAKWSGVEAVVPGAVPVEGWKRPAAHTVEVHRPNPAQKVSAAVLKDNGGSMVPPAPTVPPPHQRTKDDERAKVERMKAALAAMPVKPPLNPKDVYADRKVRDDDDVEF